MLVGCFKVDEDIFPTMNVARGKMGQDSAARLRRLRALAGAVAVAASVMALASCSSAEEEAPTSTSPAEWTNDLGIPLAPMLVGPEPGHTKKARLASGRSFLLHVPENYTPERSWPVLLSFHGYTDSPENMEQYTQFNAAHAIVAYPAGEKAAWAPAPYAATSAEEDLEFVRTLVDSLRSTYEVDDNAIYAAGLSNGGGFAAFLACRMPGTFRSVATVSAAYYEGIHTDCSDKPVGRLDIHGTKDPVVNYEGGVRHDTAYSSVSEVLGQDQRRNKCRGDVDSVRLTNGATRETWTACEAPLQHIRIEGGSHVWPGGNNDTKIEVGQGFATDAVLDFFGIPGRPEGTEEHGVA